MKKILGFYISRKKPVAEVRVVNDSFKIYNKIAEEYEAVHSRQRHPDHGPNDYMRGLMFAMKLIKEETK